MGSKSIFQFLGVDKVSPELKKINSSLKKFNDIAKTVGKAVAGYFAFNQLKDAGVKAFTDFNNLMVVRNRAIVTMGKDNLKIFDDLGTSLERTMGVANADADVVVNLASKYIALGRSAEDVEKLIKVGADLSALTGGSLTSSVEMLTKADIGNAKALKSLIPSMQELTTEQLASGEAVDLVASKVTGMSSKIYGSVTPINSLAESLDTLSETFGMLINQDGLVNSFLTGLTGYFDNLSAGIERSMTASKDITKYLKSARIEELKFAQETLQARQDQINPGLNTISGAMESIRQKNSRYRATSDKELLDAFYQMTTAQLKAIDPKLVEVMSSLKNNMSTATSDLLQKGIDEANKQAQQLSEINRKINEIIKDTPIEKTVDLEVVLTGKDLQDEYSKLLQKQSPLIFNPLYGVSPTVTPKVKGSKNKNGADKGAGNEMNFSGIFNESINLTNTFADSLTSIYSLWGDLQREQEQAQIDSLKRQQEATLTKYNLERKTKEDLGEDTTSLDNSYASNYLKTQEEIANKERELKKKAWESNKNSQLTSAIMGTANATIGALGAFPFGPWNIATAGVVGSLGLAQIGMIASQSMPSFAVGTGRVPYDMTAQIHKNEMIVPATFSDSIRKGEMSLGNGSGQTINNYFTGIIGADAVREAERLKNQLKKEGTL